MERLGCTSLSNGQMKVRVCYTITLTQEDLDSIGPDANRKDVQQFLEDLGVMGLEERVENDRRQQGL